nr:DUF3027 domain-containing protein [Corynebacterium kutscheri]
MAVKVARRALVELDEGEVGRHMGASLDNDHVATHRFQAMVAGYDGWEWNAVLACAKGTRYITVNEVALVPGRFALQAPQWVPYADRVLPGDLGPKDQLPPRDDDPRLTESEGKKILSDFGVQDTINRWQAGIFGASSAYAQNATFHCESCAFFLPLAHHDNVGACGNQYAFDAKVVTADYGCGAHSQTPPAEPLSTPGAVPFDDELPVVL